MYVVDLTPHNCICCVCVNITGVPEFTKLSLAFAYGKDSPALKENRVAGVQVNCFACSLCRVMRDVVDTGLSPAAMPSSGTAVDRIGCRDVHTSVTGLQT